MGAPIRSQTEIAQILNRAQHTLADIGTEYVKYAKRGVDSNNKDQRDRIYRLLLIRIYFQHLLTPDGVTINYYLANEKKYNLMLDALVRLSKIFDGPTIPMLGRINLPLYFFPSTEGPPPLPPPSYDGVYIDCGEYNATSNLFPDAGTAVGTGNGGLIKRANTFTVTLDDPSQPATLGGELVGYGATLRALVDNPGQIAENWIVDFTTII